MRYPKSSKQRTIDNVASNVAIALGAMVRRVQKCSTGSIYIHIEHRLCKQIRISDHTGHSHGRKVWEIRTDAMTDKKGNIWNIGAYQAMIRKLEK